MSWELPSAKTIELAKSQASALLCLAHIERKVWQAKFIGWPALHESWLRELHQARLAAQRKGWRDEL